MTKCLVTLFLILLINNSFAFEADFKVSSLYINDSRIRWSGTESTFLVEGVLYLKSEKTYPDSLIKKISANGDIFFNQPFREDLLHHEQLDKLSSNFEVKIIEIDKLNVELQTAHNKFIFGKTVSPFGKYYFPLYTNSRIEAPFIRTEAVLWRETGILYSYHFNPLVFNLSIINGTTDKDTNSSKGLISRIGMEGESYAFGVSGKIQDGIGSEWQKQYNNHAGIDFMLRPVKQIIFSGEMIYDEYGLHRKNQVSPDEEPVNLYFRDINFQNKTAIHGAGGYLDLGLETGRFNTHFNYGQYFPMNIGISKHDEPIKRFIGKIAYDFLKDFRGFMIVMNENERPVEEWQINKTYVWMIGVSFES